MTKGSEFHWQGRGKRASSPLRHISPRVIHSGRLDKKPGGEPITPIANHALDESMKASAPIYFDITDIIEHAMRNSVVTGVQRSAIRIIEGFIRNGCADQIYGFLKHPVSGQFTLCDLSFMKGAYDIGDFAARFGLPSGKEAWFAGKLLRYKNRPVKRLFRKMRLHAQWAASSSLRKKIEGGGQGKLLCCLKPLDLKAGGIIVSLGASWGSDYVGVRQLAKAHECEVVSFVHDILSLSMPADAVHGAKYKIVKFVAWLKFIAQNSSLLLCNSAFTENDLRRYLGEQGISARTAVVRFPHEFRVSSDQSGAIRSEIKTLAASKYALCVGRIEARKNVIGLLKAWAEARKAPGAKAHLLIVAGKPGAMAGEVFEFLQRTENVSGTVQVIDSPNDLELELLYRNCQFTVFPSLFEGWGLPIGESLWFGKPVICADNSSMPEVGGEFATYFTHKAPSSLAEVLKHTIVAPPKIPENIRDYLTTWDDTALSVRDQIVRLEKVDAKQIIA